MMLERSRPKSKKKKKYRSEASIPIVDNPRTEDLGGKAGKTHYTVQVGEVANLYKTSKHCHRALPNKHKKILQIDLHGLTKDEALQTLDERLPIWYEKAMSGLYPFVIPIEIICGGGNQILSEVVENWIKCNSCVCNIPKGMMRI